MTIKQQGGIFGRNPTFNNVDADGDITASGDVTASGSVISSGKLLAGTSTPLATAVPSDSRVPLVTFEDTLCPTIGLFRNDTSIVNNNTFGSFAFYGNDTTSNAPKPLAAIQAVAEGTHGSGDNPTALKILVTADGSDTPAEAARFNSAGNLEFIDGKGIDFSATSGTGTSELFDDYEEGSFQPTHGGFDMSATGLYAKIGSVVYFYFDATSNSSAATTNIIGGLPYTNGSTHSVFQVGYTNAGVTGGYISASSTNLVLTVSGGIAADNLSANERVMASGFYRV
tara:strand:- start:1695 stop:2546 length:852 start_codon:yes stop_codon:yes gene_type:complete